MNEEEKMPTYGKLYAENFRLEHNYRVVSEREAKLQNNWNKLKKWLEECLNELKQNDIYDRTSYEQGQIIALESSIAKVQELESDK